MKAILIDATERNVKEVDIKGDLQSWYDHIKCDMVEVATYLSYGDMLLVDEEGLLKTNETFFEYKGNVFAGNGLIVGTNDDGDTIGSTMDASDITPDVKFFNRQELINHHFNK